ncbi:hypothetical protein [Amycolatopsis anabasis]|uniref:hypothetical protein n=1 Tax=Amycolatopsis anabasis TaxID=1840409 RepID=UPI00131B85D6|nr:hypothetical protein [Amycolatopsis anabasis]
MTVNTMYLADFQPGDAGSERHHLDKVGAHPELRAARSTPFAIASAHRNECAHVVGEEVDVIGAVGRPLALAVPAQIRGDIPGPRPWRIPQLDPAAPAARSNLGGSALARGTPLLI